MKTPRYIINKIYQIVSMPNLLIISLFFVTIMSIFVIYRTAELYFLKIDFSIWYFLIPFVFVIIIISLSLVYYFSRLTQYFRRERLHIVEMSLILFTFLQIIILFADIYIILFCINKHAFTGVAVTNQFDLCVDFLYFSTVTFTSLGFGDIHACTSIAKIFVMAETLLFTVGVSIVLVFFIGKFAPRAKS